MDGGSMEGGDAGVMENPEDWLDRPLREQVDGIENGKITSAGLITGYLGRMDARERATDGTHAILVLDSQATMRAMELDGQRGKKALLLGAPILVKDNIDTQGMATTAGSLAMAQNVPAADATLVKKLHDAKALMFGKTNLSEWANFRGNKSISGWSSVGGQTSNGRNTKYNPCGSSSGSAAAVAAGLASAAIGTETNGSITCPASINGVVGFKPTVGLVSRAGIIPISHTQDTAGPITKTVGDAARVLSAIAGPDPADPATANIPQSLSLDFEAPLATASLQGKRLGVITFGFKPSVNAVFAAERARLVAAGATVMDVKLTGGNFGQDEYTVLTYEFKADINAYLTSHARMGQPKSLQELIDFDIANASTVMKYFQQEVFLDAQATTDLNDPVYTMAKQRAHDAAATNGIDAVMAANQLDALISPTANDAFLVTTMGDPPLVTSSSPAAVAGYPHLTVPMGTVNNLPVGISFFGKAWDDAKILALGYAYEQLAR
jgi:amidase